MQRRRDEQKKEISDEERKKKLARLRLLKKKLELLEATKADEIPDEPETGVTKKSWQPPSETVQTQVTDSQASDDEPYLQEIDKELNALTEELAQDIGTEETDSKVKTHGQIISQAFDKMLPEEKQLPKAEKSEIDAELEKLEQEINMEQRKAAVTVSIFDQLCEEHDWLKKPQFGFMYTMPNKKKEKRDYESWLDDWRKVLFDYAQIASKHIIYSRKLLSERPWSEFRDRTEAINEISDSLVKKKMAEWLDKKKKKLRIYWRSLEAWADEIVDWIRETPITGPVMIQDIRNSNKPFSDLPTDDIFKIFNIIGKRDDAEKHKLDNGDLAITVKLF